MKAGIYKITNLANGKVYIGQSINLNHRLNEHRLKLQKNKHSNEHLQNAWNKYGEDKFKFEILEECSREKLTEREDYWINFYGGYESKNNYNKKSAEEHVKYSKESKKKMSKSQKGLQTGEKNGMYGKHHTEETKEKIRQKNRINFSGENNPRYGKHCSEETKKLISKANKGRILSEEHKKAIGTWCKKQWEVWKNDPVVMENHKKAGLKTRKYDEEKRQEIYNLFKELKSRKAVSKKLEIPLESCRLIINEMIEKEKNK